MTDDVWEANRRLLEQFDPILLIELASINGEAATVHAADEGGFYAELDGHQFHDKMDPAAEAAGMVGSDPYALHLHFGFGLGYFLEADQPAPGGVILIFEPDARLLAAAMRLRPLAPLLGRSRVHLCCSLPRLRYLFHKLGGPNRRIFVSAWHARAFRPELMGFRQIIQSVSGGDARLEPLTQMYPHILRSSIRALKYNTRLPDCEAWRGRLKGKPAVLVCPGPSLLKNLSVLIKYRDRVVVFALARVVWMLNWYGIVPDFVVHVESKDYIHFLEGSTQMPDTDFLLADQAEPKFYQHDHRQTYVYHSRTNPVTNYLAAFHPEMKKFPIKTGGSVATAAFHLAVTFGCQPIVLIGQDLAHTRGKLYFAAVGGGAKVRRWTPGYFGGRESTSPNYHQNIVWYQSAVTGLKNQDPNRIFINATEGGADIQGFEKMKFDHAAYLYFKEPVTLDRPEATSPMLDPDKLAVVLQELSVHLRRLAEGLEDFEVHERRMLEAVARGQDEALDPAPVLRQYLAAFKAHPPLLHMFPKETALCRTLTQELSGPDAAARYVTAWTDLAAIYRNTQAVLAEIEATVAEEAAALTGMPKTNNATS